MTNKSKASTWLENLQLYFLVLMNVSFPQIVNAESQSSVTIPVIIQTTIQLLWITSK